VPLPPLTILHGEDDFAQSERLAALKAALGDPATASLNIAELDGRTVTLAELRGLCDSLPFLTDQRLVIVRGLLTRLTAGPRAAGAGPRENQVGREAGESDSGSTADFVDGLIAYFGSFSESAALVLAESKTLNEKHRLLKAAGQVPGAQLIKLDVPRGSELTKWILKRAKAGGGDFRPAAAEALATAAGDEPRLLANEVDKLLAYVDWARPVEAADVEELTPAAGEAVIWDLVDALGALNGPLALKKFHVLLAMPSQDLFAIFAMIVRQFRLLLQTREIVDGGGNAGAVMQALNLKGSFQADKYVRQCRNFTQGQLESIYRQLLDLDLTLKSGSGDDTAAVDSFIAGLTLR
jgi:DNA polymerase-3 subunit delta